jgi:2-dehydro-3-deoxygluconokinase
VSIDLNYRPALWENRVPKPIVEPIARGVDLLIGNARAVREMLRVDAPDDMTATAEGTLALARQLATTLGARRVALTRRELVSETRHRWSASLYDASGDTFAQSRTHDVHVVDRVGGGDSFAAALIAALLRERPPAESVEFAAAAGALKLSVPGDFGRMTTEDVERAVREWK